MVVLLAVALAGTTTAAIRRIRIPRAHPRAVCPWWHWCLPPRVALDGCDLAVIRTSLVWTPAVYRLHVLKHMFITGSGILHTVPNCVWLRTSHDSVKTVSL